MEDRSIKRTFNTLLTATKVDGKIAPLSNRDGEEPSPEIFPSTVKEFLSLNSSSILLLCEFYELVSTVEEQTELELSLTNKQPEIKSLEQRIASFTLEQFDELKDELARYLGLTFRTQSGIW